MKYQPTKIEKDGTLLGEVAFGVSSYPDLRPGLRRYTAYVYFESVCPETGETYDEVEEID